MNPRILQIITILTKGGEKMAKTIKSIGFTQNDEALVERRSRFIRRKTTYPLLPLSESCAKRR